MALLGIQLSAIGFGAFKIGRNQGIKYPRVYDLPDRREVEVLLNGVLDLGINYIDTAPAYGLSEERIGQAIAHRRDEYLISTKVGETFEDGISRHDFSERAVRDSVSRSLRRLRTDVLDLVFIHAGKDDLAILESTDAQATLSRLRDEGWIRAIGFSGYTEAAFSAALPWCDAVMVTYHQEDRALDTVMREAGEKGITVVVKKGLASGHLSAGSAVSFVLGHPHVASMVIGTLALDHVRDNLAAARRVRSESTGVAATRRLKPES